MSQGCCILRNQEIFYFRDYKLLGKKTPQTLKFVSFELVNASTL